MMYMKNMKITSVLLFVTGAFLLAFSSLELQQVLGIAFYTTGVSLLFSQIS